MTGPPTSSSPSSSSPSASAAAAQDMQVITHIFPPPVARQEPSTHLDVRPGNVTVGEYEQKMEKEVQPMEWTHVVPGFSKTSGFSTAGHRLETYVLPRDKMASCSLCVSVARDPDRVLLEDRGETLEAVLARLGIPGLRKLCLQVEFPAIAESGDGEKTEGEEEGDRAE